MDHEDTVKYVTEDVEHLKQQVESLKAVDRKIDELSKLMLEVKDGIASSHFTISKHEFSLEEIQKLTKIFMSELDALKGRVANIEKWNTFVVVIFLMVVIIITFFP